LAEIGLAEKLWVHGELLARVVGLAALAVAVIWAPGLASGLHATSQLMAMAKLDKRCDRRTRPRAMWCRRR
jgi:hypothetical protein